MYLLSMAYENYQTLTEAVSNSVETLKSHAEGMTVQPEDIVWEVKDNGLIRSQYFNGFNNDWCWSISEVEAI